ncbi:hypothetical protein [Moheibacter sediminis]|uniref:Right handed beta helix region n=1 Tax=Moheibacter sediminis TaxID=1434700 RepID=A0A1W1Z052_9FLAO|nr:hypothetical protein [Moheibacter sediminis]SMC41461.1 hypothetical protein SAMN06296427_10254 [Moheibacter sediminis]
MQIRSLVTGAILLLIIGITSCRDDFDFDPASDELGFSTDTISLDTIFNHTNSQTYKFTVHNRQNKDVEIPRIYLSRGESSLYKLNVDGMPGYAFENVPVRAKDSIFIFVEMAAGEAPVNPLYEDEVVFETTNGSQNVKLLSWIEKAKFYIPEQGQTDVLITEPSWDNSESRVIFGNAVVNNNLTIQGGTRVYFHNGAGMTVNGNLTVNGQLGNEVRFRSDRHDERSDSLPNMWGEIKIKSPNTSILNKIDYAIIKGGNIGLEVENSRLEISNTKILNNESIGLYAKNANITGYNLVINNSNITALGIEGGTYDFRHCTFANYHNIGQGIGSNHSLVLSNDGASITQANFYNNIFYGRASNAIVFDSVGSGAFIHDFRNNLIRNDFGDLTFPASNITEGDPLFVNPGFGTNDLRLKIDSPAAQNGDIGNQGVDQDILQIARPNNPTLGAYQQTVTP